MFIGILPDSVDEGGLGEMGGRAVREGWSTKKGVN